MPYTFEDKIDIINREINKRKGRWKLKAIPSIDFEDVSQILRIHIHQKWDKWDQTRPLEPWLNTVLTNQMINLVRNLYGNYARPCVSGDNGKPCPANQGGDLCAIYGKQGSVCPLYAYWEKHKKSAYDTKLPLPLESHSQEVFSIPEGSFDISKQIEKLHVEMKKALTPMQYRVYTYLYVEGKTDEEVAKLMGYKTNEKNRFPGYKQIPNMRKVIIQKAKKIISKDL
jgi:DNA-directed RNA polymerase specialized sigma24 family protein